MAEFRYLTAAEWGMTWKRPAVPEKLNDPEVFVHHSAGSRLGTDAVRAFQALNRWAQDGKNYSALDYDILVHRDVESGLITIGGGREEWMSAATLDRNEQGEAICVMGYFHPGHVLSEQPHPDEIEGVARGIVWGIEKGWIARDAKILGHFENPAHPGATGCPGQWFIPHLPTIRRRVAELLTQQQPPEDDDMPPFLWRHTRYANVFYVEAANVITLDPAGRDRALAAGVPLYESAHDQMLKSCRVKAGLEPADLTPMPGE